MSTKNSVDKSEWRVTFLKALAQTANVGLACRLAQVSRQAAYKARKRDIEFGRLWESAIDDGLDALELHIYRTGAKKDWKAAAWMLSRRRPSVYGDRQTVDASINGKTEIVVRWADKDDDTAK